MRKTAILLLSIPALTLSSCSFINKVKSLFTKQEEEPSIVEDYGLTDKDNEWKEPNASDFTYEDYNGGIKLTSYSFNENIPTISVPKEINGKKVVAIASNCFKKKKPSSRPMEENPDYDPNAPTYYIGDNVIQMDESCFNVGATFFTSYAKKPPEWLDQSITYYSAIDDKGNTYYSTTPKEIFIYKGVIYYEHKSLNAYFVAKCLTNDSEITIAPRIKGKSVITIGTAAFTGNSNLESISLPYTLVDLKAEAFRGCTNLKNINFYDSNLTFIRENAFTDCTSLSEIRLPKNIAQLRHQCFSNCGTIKTLYIPQSISKLATRAFSDTEVEEIYYGGTQEMWLELINGRTVDGLSNVVMHYESNVNSYVLDTPSKEFETFDNGSVVTVTGIVSGYSYEMDRLYLTNPETGYTILCYDNINHLYDDDSEFGNAIGRKITVTGRIQLYYNLLEIIKPKYSFVDDKIYEVKPTEVDWTTNKFEDNVGLYTTISGYVKNYTYGNLELRDFGNITIKGHAPNLSKELRGTYITAYVFVGRYGEFAELYLYGTPVEINEDL